MAITLPNLDDRTYADLVEEARGLIPNYAPEWTNHNPSDPGITLVELFAYLTEMLIYRLNRVTDANMCAFLQLIDSVKTREPTDRPGIVNESWTVDGHTKTREVGLTEAIQDVVSHLRTPYRAVTSKDYEDLVLAEFREHPDLEKRVARARCEPRRNLTDQRNQVVDAPGHVSVVIVPVPTPQDHGSILTDEAWLSRYVDLIQAIKDHLEPRRLLTTRLHVVGPRYVGIGVRLTLHLKPDALKTIGRDAEAALATFFDPVDANGWPFGRNVYVSEVYELLDKLPGVDFVTKTDTEPDELLVTFDPRNPAPQSTIASNRLQRNSAGELVGVELFPDELVAFNAAATGLKLMSPLPTKDARGG